MPFVAFDPERNERIDILHYRWPKEELAGRRLVCRLCGVTMDIRYRQGYLPHFVHRQHCPYEGWHHSETPEHLATKETLCAWLKQDPFWQEAAIDTEQKVLQTRRVPDVLAVFPDGTRVAHECQLSPMTVERFWERCDDYKEAGVTVFWWFDGHYLVRKQKIDLWRAVRGHQGVLLLARLKRGPNPYRHDPGHRRHHTWPEEVGLWLNHDDLTGDEFRRLTGEPSLSIEAQRWIWLPVLWPPVYRVLKEAEVWVDQDEIHARLHPVWQARFVAKNVDELLITQHWGRGQVVAGPGGRWLLPYLPGFDSLRWWAWRDRQKVEEGVEDKYLELSTRYHCEWWAEHFEKATTPDELRAVGETIADVERNELVRERLRPLYQKRLERLKRRKGK